VPPAKSVALSRLRDSAPLEYAPNNEQGVIFLFSQVARKKYGLRIERIQAGYPDCIAIRQGKRIRIEFEYRSRNFVQHKHDPKKCDWIVCWIHDWPAAPKHLRVIELRTDFGHGFNVWFQPVSGDYGEHLSRSKSAACWTVPSQAMVGDLLLYYRTAPQSYVADIFKLSSPVRREKWKPSTRKDWMGGIRRVCTLKTPLHFSEMKTHPTLRHAGFVRGGMQGRYRASDHWPELFRMIVGRNPPVARLLAKFGPDRIA